MSNTPTPAPDATGPRVTLPKAGPSPVIVAIALCLAGGGVIWASQAQFGAHKAGVARTVPPAANLAPTIAPLEIPPPPPPAPPAARPVPEIRYVPGPPPPPVIQYVNRPGPPPAPPAPEPRLAEPVMTIDLPSAAPAESAAAEDTPARAVVIHNRAMLVPQGALIPAAIETPIDSSAPGAVRALTTGDTRGFDGTRVLIPRGSHLIGEFKAGTQANQDRVTIVWTRLIRPDGIAIKLSAPGADLQGGAGVPGRVDTHLLARMGSAAFQSVLTVGVALASRPGNGSVVLGLPAQTASGVAQAGAAQGENAPTIRVAAGTPVMVFVNRDMDFAGVLPRR
jgi:type IV secretion system protein VirB10